MVVQVVGTLIALIAAFLLAIPLIRYRITPRWLLITLLGVPLRWISLGNIRSISDHCHERYEPWPNTHNPKTRILFIRKRHGLFRHLLITPHKRFVFKAELEKAIHRLDPTTDPSDTRFFEAEPAPTLQRRQAES